MTSFILKRGRTSSLFYRNLRIATQYEGFPFSSSPSLSNHFPTSHSIVAPSSLSDSYSRCFSNLIHRHRVLASGVPSYVGATVKWPCGYRLFGSQAAVEPSTSDGLTVERIVANQWTILDESESDWKSHAAAVAQSIHVIKKRLQWNKLLGRLEQLSLELDKADIWDDPVYAGKISREHGSLMGKMKEVKTFEQELLEHIDLLKLAREEDDSEMESVGFQIL